MLHILLLILKIIGLLFSAAIGILLLALFCVLFVPVRYQILADGKLGAEEPVHIEIKVAWLLHMISGVFSYPGNTGIRVKLFGLTLWNSSKREKDPADGKKGRGKNKKQEVEKGQKDGPEKGSGETKDGEESIEGQGKEETTGANGQEPIIGQEAAESIATIENKEEAEGHTGRLKEFWKALCRFFRKLLDALENIEYTIQELCGKIKSTMENLQYYIDILRGETFRSGFGKAKGQLLWVLKKIKPGKCRIDLVIGLEDPAGTGQIMAVYGMLYPFVGRNVSLQPEFEKKIMEGDVCIKGKITVIVFLTSALKLYMDKNIRKLIKMLKREDA